MTYGFRSLVDPEAEGPAPLRLEFPASGDADVVLEALVAWFDADQTVQRIALVVEDEHLGLVTRARMVAVLSHQPRLDPGAGDGASLPGRSSQYTMLTYRCGRCAATAKVLFVDTVPECADHGPMDRVS